MSSSLKATLLLATLAVVASSCGTSKVSTETPLASAPGITSTTVLFGSVQDSSSSAATALEAGIRAAFSYVNVRGGVYGRRLDLLVSNDKGKPLFAAASVAALAHRVGVFATIGDGPYGLGCLLRSYSAHAGLPMLESDGPACGSGGFYLAPQASAEMVDIGEALKKAMYPDVRIAYVLPRDLANETLASFAEVSAVKPLVVTDSGSNTALFNKDFAALLFYKPDVVVSFLDTSQTANLLAGLYANHLAPTLIATQTISSLSVLKQRFAAATGKPLYSGKVARYSPWLYGALLNRAWRSEISRIAKYLAPGVVLGYQSETGIFIGLSVASELERAGLNPTRRLLAVDWSTPELPGIGSYSALGGFSGGVLFGLTRRPIITDKSNVVSDAALVVPPPSQL